MKQMKTDFTFISFDKKELKATKFIPQNPKAILLIAHGMAEHRKRYFDFAEFLCKNHIAVFIYDCRGHGDSVNINKGEELGFFAENRGWTTIENDLKLFTSEIKNEFPNTPFFVIGHSMGSFLVRTYLRDINQKIDGVILSGTSGPVKTAVLGLLVAKIEKFFKGDRYKSKSLNGLIFKSFNKKFFDKTIKNHLTGFEWLSSDIQEVKKYASDPYCGFVCTTSFYCDLLGGMIKANSKETIEKYKKELNIFIISGEKDPVGDNTKSVNNFYNILKNNFMKNVTLKFYKDFRHEVLNEKNRATVYSDILNWINMVLLG